MKYIFTLILSIVIALVLVVAISSYHRNNPVGSDLESQNLLYKIFGGTTQLLSGYMTVKAGEYLHGGLPHPAMEELKDFSQNHHHECKHLPAYQVSKLNILVWLKNQLRIVKHIHLEGDKVKEMLPWYYYAAKLDPHNVQAYLNGGYWLYSAVEETDEGEKFLNEGIANNPESFQLHFQRGVLYLSKKKNYKKALSDFKKAEILFDSKTASFEQRILFLLITSTYERLNQPKKALEYIRKVQELFPENKINPERIKKLRSQISGIK